MHHHPLTDHPPPTACVGDWFKVERLIRETNGDDSQLVHAWNKIGQYYSDRHKWAKAAQVWGGQYCSTAATGTSGPRPHRWGEGVL